MLKIWRVENEIGEGCYRNLETQHIISWGVNITHPSPQKDKDIKREPEENEICGFRNLSQAKIWFNQYELKGLSEIGYKLKKVEVEEITAFGEKQVLAIR